MAVGTDLLAGLRAEALGAPPSGILEVFRRGRGKPGLIPMWAGEGDLADAGLHLRRGDAARSRRARRSTPTMPAFRICARRSRAITTASMAVSSERRSSPERFFVTIGGHARDPDRGDDDRRRRRRGDRADAGLAELRRRAGIRGARPVEVPMTARDGRFELDLDAPRGRDHAGDPRDLRQQPVQPDRLDRRRGDAGGDPRPGAPARPVDHRRRDLRPLRLRPGQPRRRRSMR